MKRYTRKRVGGDILGKGAHKITYNVGCTSDGESLCTKLGIKRNLGINLSVIQTINRIKLYCDNRQDESINSGNNLFILEQPDEIKNFLIFIQNNTDEIASIFRQEKNPSFKEFTDEIKVNRAINKIYGNDATQKYLTSAPFIWNGLHILGMVIEVKRQAPQYVIFGTKCKPIDLKSEFYLNKFIFDVLESLVILQNKGFEHNDIKLDNVVACGTGPSTVYKLIDWGQSDKIKANYNDFRNYPPKIGARISTSPMRWFLSGRTGASLRVVARELIQYMATNTKRFNMIAGWGPFIELTNRIKLEFDERINGVYFSYDRLFDEFKNTFDIFMLGMTILHATYLTGSKREETYKIYKPLIEKFTSLREPLLATDKSVAEQALFFAKQIIT